MTEQRGFTLLEILVVVTIVAILTGFVVLRLRPAGMEDVLDTELRRVAALTGAVCEQAIIATRTMGVVFNTGGYAFYLAADGQWLPVEARRFRPRTWPDGIISTLDVEGFRVSLATTSDAPQVVCSATGERSAFEFTLQADRWSRRLIGQTHGDLRIE